MRVLYGLRTIGKETLPLTLLSIFFDSLDRGGGDVYIIEKAPVKARGSIFNELLNNLLYQVRETLTIHVRMQNYYEDLPLGSLTYEIIEFAKRNGYDYLVLVDDDVVFRLEWDGIISMFERDKGLVWIGSLPYHEYYAKLSSRDELKIPDTLLDPSLSVLRMDRVVLDDFKQVRGVNWGEHFVLGIKSRGVQTDKYLHRWHLGYEENIGLSTSLATIRELYKCLRGRHDE